MIQMNAHAATAIHEMLKGIDYLFAEIGGEHSIMSVLLELGIEAGDLASAQTAVHKAIEPKMKAFETAAEKLKMQKQTDQNAGEQPKDISKPIAAQPVRP